MVMPVPHPFLPSPFPLVVTAVSACGYCRSRLWLLSFPLGGTGVPAWGNCRSCVRKLSFPMGWNRNVLILNMVSIYILAFPWCLFRVWCNRWQPGDGKGIKTNSPFSVHLSLFSVVLLIVFVPASLPLSLFVPPYARVYIYNVCLSFPLFLPFKKPAVKRLYQSAS